jgi:hypothetical protein
MGAASAVLGLMVGMAIPETEIENEYMGEARDNALEGVQQTVRETVNKVQDAASNVVGMVAGDQNQPGSKQQVQPSANQAQKPGVGVPLTGSQAIRSDNRPGNPAQPGGQTPGPTGQPPKNPGIV